MKIKVAWIELKLKFYYDYDKTLFNKIFGFPIENFDFTL